MIASDLVEIDSDARVQIGKLGLERQFEEMIDHAVQSIPGLQRLHAVFPPNYEYEDDMVFVHAYGPWNVDQMIQVGDDYFQWVRETYSSDVFGYVLLTAYSTVEDESSQIS